MIEFKIFWVFLKISFLSFGGVFGVLPELERMVVLQHGWLSHDQFIQSYVMAQFVPGPNMAMCPLIGYWVAGWSGMLAGFFGIYLGPVCIMTATYATYHNFRKKLWMKRFEISVRPVIVGLLVSSTLNIWWNQSQSSTHFLVNRIGAAILGLLFIQIFLRKKMDPLKLIISFGFLWWLFQWSLIGFTNP